MKLRGIILCPFCFGLRSFLVLLYFQKSFTLFIKLPENSGLSNAWPLCFRIFFYNIVEWRDKHVPVCNAVSLPPLMHLHIMAFLPPKRNRLRPENLQLFAWFWRLIRWLAWSDPKDKRMTDRYCDYQTQQMRVALESVVGDVVLFAKLETRDMKGI